MLDKIKTFPFPSFKLKLILTFCSITILLVVLMSMLSYRFVREIYLNQLAEQVSLAARLIGAKLDTQYLALIPEYDENTLARLFYIQILSDQTQSVGIQGSFIFDSDYKILVHSDQTSMGAYHESRLLLNRSEIENLQIGEAAASLPFKGQDDAWYMWGFYRLGENHWLGIQESASRLARIENLSRLFWGIGLMGILLSVLAGWLLAKTIARPIEQLVTFSHRLGKGDFDAPLPQQVRGELAILASAMDKMRNDLALHQQEKEEMLAQIAHEIRNPLGGMELLAGLVREDLQKKGESSQYIEKIEEEIRGLKALITAYLEYSRPAPTRPQWVNPQQTVQEIRELLKSELESKGIELSCNGTVEAVWFDPNHLRQVLLNLVSNSVEALNGKGKISIQTSRSNNEFLIRVTDDGPGIPPQEQQKIFQPFFTTKDEGTGLGLAICRKLCRENGAEIRVESAGNRGCTLTIVQNS